MSISPDALGLYLRLAYIPAPYALLKDSHMLEPGSWIEFAGETEVRQGRFFHFPREQTPTLKGGEAIEALDAAITNAVRRHLISDVPVGAFLSGGIDSPLVVAKMRCLSSSPIKAFTIGTNEGATDESLDAIRYAQDLGVEHVVETLSPTDALERLHDVIDACGEPFGDYSIFPTMMVTRLASRNYKVMLSGDGGDELFWGYPKRFGPLVKYAKNFGSPAALRRLQGRVRRFLGPAKAGAPLAHRTIGDWHRQMLTHLAEPALRRIYPSLPEWPAEFAAFKNEASDSQGAAQGSRWTELECHLPYVLMKVDRASMYHSLEVRVPLLDREVMATAARMDWQECLDPDQGLGKLPLRKLLARHTHHQTRAKRGFEAPMATWLRTSLQDLFRDTVLQRKDLLGLEVNTAELSRTYDLHQQGQANYAWGLWPLLSLAMWVDRHYCRRKV